MLVTTGVGGPIQGVIVQQVPGHPELEKYVGRTLGEIAECEGKHHIDAMLDIHVGRIAKDHRVLNRSAKHEDEIVAVGGALEPTGSTT